MKFPILAWLIMIFQSMKPWSDKAYSHMAISFLSQTGNWLYADSTSKGVRVSNTENFKAKYKIIETIRVKVPEGIAFGRWLEQHLGKSYDNWQIVGLAIRLFGFMSLNTLGANWAKMTCNELVLSLIWRFKGIDVVDPDLYDLKMTWKVVESVENV